MTYSRNSVEVPRKACVKMWLYVYCIYIDISTSMYISISLYLSVYVPSLYLYPYLYLCPNLCLNSKSRSRPVWNRYLHEHIQAPTSISMSVSCFTFRGVRWCWKVVSLTWVTWISLLRHAAGSACHEGPCGSNVLF